MKKTNKQTNKKQTNKQKSCRKFQKSLHTHKHQNCWNQGTSQTIDCSLIASNSTVKVPWRIYLTIKAVNRNRAVCISSKISRNCGSVACGKNRGWLVHVSEVIADVVEVKYGVFVCWSSYLRNKWSLFKLRPCSVTWHDKNETPLV